MRWHYQWIVLNNFLPRLLAPGALEDIRANGRKFYDFEGAPFRGHPFMPLEFSGAAYRLGHSMVRETYNYNRVFNSLGPPSLKPRWACFSPSRATAAAPPSRATGSSTGAGSSVSAAATP